MDRLFALPWYKIGRHGNEDAEAKDAFVSEKEAAMEAHDGVAHHVEAVHKV